MVSRVLWVRGEGVKANGVERKESGEGWDGVGESG
jgi:hypothetical protein